MGEVVQFRDYGHQPSKRVNAAAERAFWMGHTGKDGKGTMLTGPVADDLTITKADKALLKQWLHERCGPDDLTMACADPETVYEAPDGDCA